MNQEERLISILNYLELHKTINIKQICEKFNVSRDTARRDIVNLTNQNLVTRTYGGIAIPSFHKQIEDYQERLQIEPFSKNLLGQAAANMINDSDLVYLDISTTVNFIPQYLESKEVTVVTNSIDCVYELVQSDKATIHILGGIVNKSSRHVSGYSAIEKLSDFNFNKVFIGTAGITEDGIYYGFEEDIYFKRELIKNANHVILLADYTKFNKHHKYKGLPYNSIHTIITDKTLPDNLNKVISKNGIEIKVVNKE
ncbi:DeoR/GlpR family DNA-binding transcription regulator [Paenibacillus sp. FSL H7-0331]|uniref:DeoR/GlpR family DNA-binding transcription regulator n=1 Tax=Paenibacillus sp. FSL H7-0331 TaxID=1920421 RepID=UPI00096FB9C8|nr:DeoR/GlpR family DNA-binding transcription regulator [Paenibacillus sp. FSL H7-0331]OMF12795.1 DeoR family transcriptional regulator [Paenibacillus sp. FSL H7-0331]